MAITIADYSFRQLITGTSPASSLSGLTVLITEANVDSTFWSNVDNGGGDVRVSINSDGTSQLPIEIVLCNTTTDKLVAWVRFPTYSTAARELYVFSGNTGQVQPAVTATYGRNSVWVDYNLADHGGNLIDSSGNAGSVAKRGTVATEVSPYGDAYGATNSNDTVDYTSVPNVQFPFTIQAWYNPSDGNTNARFISIGNSGSTQNYSQITNSLTQAILSNNGGNDTFTTTISTTAWHLTHGVVTSATDYEIFIDNLSDGNSTSTISHPSTIDQYRVGASADRTPFGTTNASVAEIKIRKSALSDNYIAIEYSNQSAPASFWTQSTPDDPSGGGGATILPASITSLEVFGTQVITTGLVTLSPSAISSLESFGTTVVATSALLTPSAIASLEVFGTANVSTEKTLSPSSIASLEAFGNAVLSAGGVNISPNGITTLEAFGTADVAGVLVTVSPTSIASLEAFGNAVLQRLLVSLLPTGIVTQEAFGTPLVVGGDAILIPIENRQTWNAIATYLRKVTFKGSNNDVIVSWLRSEGIVDGAYNDLWDRYLLQNGYLALTLTDKYAAWRQGVVTELFNSSGVMTCGGTLSCTEIIPCG
jgi:hypothetical protein